MVKLEDYNNVILSLKDEIEVLTEQSKRKETENDQLRNKIKDCEEQIQNITNVKVILFFYTIVFQDLLLDL